MAPAPAPSDSLADVAPCDASKARSVNHQKSSAFLPWAWAALAALACLAGWAGGRWTGHAGPAALSVSACGDVMMQNVDSGKTLDDASLMGFMSAAAPWFQTSDVGFVNLEGPVGGSQPKPCSSPHCWRFKQGPSTPDALRAAGVSAVSLANNHANDMGESGQASSLAALDRAGIRSAGLFARPSARWRQNGLSVELLAMTANSFAPDFRRPEALASIRAAKERSDIVILSLHMGCEGERCARLQGGKETYLGEDRGDPKAFGNAAVDAGADLVLGSGPHVPRGLALRDGRLIAYSLGNCAVGPGLSTAGKAALAPVLRAELDAKGRLASWDVGSFIGSGFKLTPDPSQRALLWMIEATRLDSGEAQWEELHKLWTPAPARTQPGPSR